MVKINPEAQLAVKLYRQTKNNEYEATAVIHATEAARDASMLMGMARSIHRLAEAACNRELTKAEQKRDSRLEKSVSEILAGYGLVAKFNGDPRGYAVNIHFPDGSYNTWGGKEEGWGI